MFAVLIDKMTQIFHLFNEHFYLVDYQNSFKVHHNGIYKKVIGISTRANRYMLIFIFFLLNLCNQYLYINKRNLLNCLVRP